MDFRSRVLVVAGFCLLNLPNSWPKPVPAVLPPGVVQPLAPGQRPARALPTLEWPGRAAEIQRVEYASNGFIEVAHALILVKAGKTPAELLYLTRQAVDGALEQRPQLHEVDVSVYAADSYAGFGGPTPLLTASVARSRVHEFVRQGLDFERLHFRDSRIAHHSPGPALPGREQHPIFHGDDESIRLQQRRQEAESVPLQEGLFFHGSPLRKEVALTFDDSPHPLYEPLLLDTLRRARVKATFFCIGRNARAYPYFIEDMAREGHEVANHTYHHVRLPGLSDAQIHRELNLAREVLEKLSKQDVNLFRPPGGDYSPQTLQLTRSAGLTTVFWTDDPCDFDNPGDGVIENRLLERLRPGGIILIHDNVQETINILPAFVKLAQREGYRLITAGELIRRQTP